EVLVDALSSGYVYQGTYSPARDRIVGRCPEGLRGRNLIACIQNHDQVGNRARGDRIGHIVSTAHQRIGAALLLTSPFVPLIFQGEEWAASSRFPFFAAHTDPDLAEAIRRGRRDEFAAFGWSADEVSDPESDVSFELAVLNWDERSDREHQTMLRW